MWPTFREVSGVDRHIEHELRVPLGDLPRIAPCFFVPPLENKPQNPIMDSLKLEKLNSNLPPRLFQQQQSLPKELALLALDLQQEDGHSPSKIEALWNNAVKRRVGIKDGVLSWDRLRPSHSDRASTTAYLSEQSELVYASARYYVQPRLFEPTNAIIYVTQRELLISLKMVVLGFSSPYHLWDPAKEAFMQVGTNQGLKKGLLLLDGKDEVISESLISRFLKIGTLLRRLESILSALRTRSAKEGPTIHALAHTLSTTLDYVREALLKCPPTVNQLAAGHEDLPLLAICSHYAIYEEILIALADLLGRNDGLAPQDYLALDSSPVSLLSRIYEHLTFHFEHHSPGIIRAIIAFILTGTSQEYIQDVGHSIGFGGQASPKPSKIEKKRNGEYEFDLDDEEEEEDIFDALDKIETSFPVFFPQKILQALPAAQKSLVLFRIAQPDHHLLTSPAKNRDIRWLWTADEIDASWNGLPLPPKAQVATSSVSTVDLAPPSATPYEPDLSDFQAFDLEPGSLPRRSCMQVKDSAFMTLQTFIHNFSTSLPSITPTLSELSTLTFKDLLDHASVLSEALLSLFVSSPGILNFQSHLVLLRSYLLVAAPPFKLRLLNALFSDAGEYEIDTTAHAMSIRSLRQRPSSRKTGPKKQQPWAVGLSPNLLEREMWPPVGADLSFFLRTVIVDSLESGRETQEGDIERDQVVAEAEWRLGFAIRDLPTGSGRDKWLDPLSIEALDFLYMDYKPPRPLEILISPEVLSKYQRMFTFILRLLRVESALKSLFRMSTHRAIATFLFPTLTSSRKLLLHFRFIAQSFVVSLSGYVFDTAIGGNFDPFLERLSPTSEKGTQFSDIFELGERHSALLDDILSACLLRSGQKGVGELLRHSLELILEFTIVVGELHRGRIQEYQAAPMIEELFHKFCTKVTTLTKVLKGLVDKNSSASKLSFENVTSGGRHPTGGLDALYHLLIRLDLTDWWSKTTKC